MDPIEEAYKDDLIEKLRNDRDRYRYLYNKTNKALLQLQARIAEIDRKSKAFREEDGKPNGC